MSPSLRGHDDLVGRPRARFLMHWPWYVWAVLYLLPVVVAAVILATGSPGAAIVLLLIVLVLVALPLTWFLRRHQLILTDHAIVMGTFVPGVAPEVLFLTDLDVPAIRTWSNLRAYLRSTRTSSLESGQMITEGSRLGISLPARRAGRLQDGRLVEDDVVARTGRTVELFALSGGAERLVHRLAEVMSAAGIPAAQDLPRTALPPRRLTGQKDSHRTEIPGWPEPSASRRFEDLPPDLQEKVRRHVIDD